MKSFIRLLIICLGFFPFAVIAQEQRIQNTSTNGNNAILPLRHFNVDANVFIATFRDTPGLQTNSATSAFKSFFSASGVDWKSPQGKSIFYNVRLGTLFVRATESDLAVVEHTLQVLNSIAPQVRIKVLFMEMPENTFQDFVVPNLFTNVTTKPKTNGRTELLTDKKFRFVYGSLEEKPEAMILAEPEAIATSGQQCQLQAAQLFPAIVNSFNYQKNTTNSTDAPQSGQIEIGPVLDVVPIVLSDGHTIDLTIKASLPEFLGYEKGTNSLADSLPILRVRQFSAHAKIWEGQTVVMGKLEGRFITQEKMDNTKDKEVLIFITAALVDLTGNRIHSDDELPFAKNGFPPQ